YNTDTDCAEMFFQTGWGNMGCGCTSYPNAQFTFSPLSPSANSPVSFSISPTPGATYSWTFTGGSPAASALQNLTLSWNSAGSYMVSLTVTDPQGCASTLTDTIVVANCPSPGSTTVNFSYTGQQQIWVVPATCVNSITVDVIGAKGGISSNSGGGS